MRRCSCLSWSMCRWRARSRFDSGSICRSVCWDNGRFRSRSVGGDIRRFVSGSPCWSDRWLSGGF